MKWGLIARGDNTGLGIQTWEMYRNLRPDRVMLVDFTAYKHMQFHPDRYSGADVLVVHAVPSFEEVDTFLAGLDLVFTCETPYSYHLLKRARELGIRTMVQPNYEFAGWINRPSIPGPDAFGVPSRWHFDDFPANKIFLPVPIATDRFDFRESDSARKFMHVVGVPAANDRNGTRLLVEALKHVTANIEIEFFAQASPRDGYIETMLNSQTAPRNVRLKVNRTSPTHYWQMYTGQDVLIMPRRYGGLCLPVNEALGAGMPVIMSDIEPNNNWLPEEWLVPAEREFDFQPGRYGNKIDVYATNVRLLASRIDRMAADPRFFRSAQRTARSLAMEYGWPSLSKLYYDTFNTMMRVP